VLVDYGRGSAQGLEAARQVAGQSCAMFGKSNTVLESLNLRGQDKERAAFLCQ
jgi:hypothetical protein